MMAARPLVVGFAALAGCVSAGSPDEFRLTAEQLNGAWGPVMARAWREAEADGIDPLWDPVPRFSDATCRWIEPGSKALCRYRASRGFQRPGHEHWVDEEGELHLTETGWDFGY
jgi:hypothetical protein